MQLISQINTKNLKEGSFWAKAKEEKLEKRELFEELSKAFAAKGAPRMAKTEDQEGGGKKAAAKKKAKELKILDPKSAQNLCKCTALEKLLCVFFTRARFFKARLA